MSATVLHGDCRDILPTLPDCSVDAVVTDPPYELSFMGKGWDSTGIAYSVPMWAEVLRVLKPGGHLLSFGGSRTWHRMAAAIEDAGFEMRDCITWHFGSGFPKSLDVSKAIDKAGGDPLAFRRFARAYAEAVATSTFTHSDIDRALGIKSSSCYWAREDHRGGMPPRHHWALVRDLLGLSEDFERLYDEAEREVIGAQKVHGAKGSAGGFANGIASQRGLGGGVREIDITAPATPDAERWQGWATALKPATEFVTVARRPLVGTVAANVLEWGTGALNVGATRIGTTREVPASHSASASSIGATGISGKRLASELDPNLGRWPANVILDEYAAAELDRQSGDVKAGGTKDNRECEHGFMQDRESVRTDVFTTYGDTGGASRFFYVAKAPKSERPKVNGIAHATVKPLTLIRYLVRLVTPPCGTVLDPFAGSGTTGEAAILEGFNAILIEREADHIPLIHARIERAYATPLQDNLLEGLGA